MGKHTVQLFVSGAGDLSIIDLSPLELRLVKSLGINIAHPTKAAGKHCCAPQHVSLRNISVPDPLPDTLEELALLHNLVLNNPDRYRNGSNRTRHTIFHLKRRIVEESLKECRFCGFLCGGKRSREGLCPILKPSRIHEHFIHLSEEREVGVTIALDLLGCNLRCKFCQKADMLRRDEGKPFNRATWKEIRKEYRRDAFNNISFLGGNPDQSILGAIDFIGNAPKWALDLPIIWHTNGYGTPDLYNVLRGLVDMWVFDFKYFSDNCAVELSRATNYAATAKKALQFICDISKHTPIIVRHLLLPGHWGCCQKPLIQWLAGSRSDIILNLMPQYKPMGEISDKDGSLSRTLDGFDFIKARDLALANRLVLTQLRYS